MIKQFNTFRIRLARYWRAYGGFGAIFGSPVFCGALIMATVRYDSWIKGDWPQLCQAILPNLLGFSLGTYAILFSLMTSRLKRALKAEKGENQISFLDEINATFFHFIFVQVIALSYSVIFQSTLVTDLASLLPSYQPALNDALRFGSFMFGFLGFLLFAYAVLLSIAAAVAVYRLANIVDPAG